MEFKLKLDVDNSSFHDDHDCVCDDGETGPCDSARNHEVARIVKDVASCLRQGIVQDILRDGNGNRVGSWGYEDE